jgi:hypothetical protein
VEFLLVLACPILLTIVDHANNALIRINQILSAKETPI